MLFDKFAGPGIQQMYCDINELLIQWDILPKVTASLRPHGPGPGRRTRVIIETEDDDGTSLGVDVFSKLQQLMMDPVNEIAAAGSIYPGATNPAPTAQNEFPPLAGPTLEHGVDAADRVAVGGNPNLAGPYATRPIATARFVDTLTLLQHGNLSTLQAASPGGNVLDRTQIEAGDINVLRTLKETGAIGVMNPNDGLTLDIVSILFDYIFDDRTIPDAMKALIGRLQIPLLKVALLDKTLFSKKAHPARRLLDSLAAAAVGWSESKAGHDGLYEVTDRIVHRIIDEFENELAVFESALAEIEAYIAQERDDADKRAATSTRSLRIREQR